ncbi:MAG: response regulator [Candidatus Kariarchaeaceae archaeon]|jgi:FixJ family two-component response regulator
MTSDKEEQALSIEKKLVLFVDDEIEILNSIKRQLSLHDTFNGIYESNPVNVMQIIENNPVDIIVADIVMPELDGIILLSQIKEKYPDIVRIMLTAHGDYNTSIRAINEADVFGFITKPWEKSYLFGHLHMAAKLVERRKDGDPSESQDVHSVVTMLSLWDDSTGAKILAAIPMDVSYNIGDVANRSFMSAAGFFGYRNRFNKSIFTMPINEIKQQARLFLDKKGNQPFGIFVINSIIPTEIEEELDKVLKKLGKEFVSGKDPKTIISELSEEVNLLLNHK